MEAKLIIVGGKANKGHVSLKLPTVVGRSRDADLTIAHPMVSRRHCELFEENGLLMVRDLGSLNGTIVRKERITSAVPIRPEEEFTVGPLTFRADYEYAGEVAAPPSPPQFATEEGEPPPEFFAEEEPSAEESQAPSLEPAASGKEAGIELPDFAAWDKASEDKTPETPAEAPASPAEAPASPAEAPVSPPRLPASSAADGKSPEAESSSDVPKFPAADGEEEASDFALGPVTPRSPELDKLLAPSEDDDGPPSFEDPSSSKQKKASGGKAAERVASKQKSGESAAPASSNGQKPAPPKEFSEEDLDEFFKDAI